MIRSIDAGSDRFLSNLKAINARLERAQREAGTGKRLLDASDDPDAVANLLTVQSELARLEQTRVNLGRIKTEADSAEMSLQNAVKLMDRVRSLGMTGAGGMQDAQTRRGIADEIGAILERMVGLANTEVDGRFIFSGDSDMGPSYELDWQQDPPWSAYQGTPATRRAIHPSGITFPVSKDAREIWNNPDPAKDVFQSIETLREALLSNDDGAIRDALAPLAGISAHLNSMLTFYGNVQGQVVEATDTASKLKLQIETERANLEDADITEVIVELQKLRFTQQAAMEVRGQTPRTSLFDYLG